MYCFCCVYILYIYIFFLNDFFDFISFFIALKNDKPKNFNESHKFSYAGASDRAQSCSAFATSHMTINNFNSAAGATGG